MKRFRFRLERILIFRRHQRRQTELRLQDLHREEAGLVSEGQVLVEQEQHTKNRHAGVTHTTGTELRAYQSYLVGVDSRRGAIQVRLQQNRAGALQVKAELVECDRQVKLLEKLRERRLKEHQRRDDRDERTEAAESSLNRWRRS